MRVLLAFDKFKDALSASQACAAAAAALADVRPEWQVDACPLTDGGEGFCAVLTTAVGGQRLRVPAHGPRGTPLIAEIGEVPVEAIAPTARTMLGLPERDARLAIVEMAAASGLALLPFNERDIWQTSTAGTGELLRAAAARNPAAILLGIGGSATNDLGFGALHVLGLEFRNASGQPVDPIPARWSEIFSMARRVADLPPIHIACDVANPLLGPRGAAAVFGPQKGLRPEDRSRLEHAMARVGLLLCHHCRQPDTLMDVPGMGAAGGIAFGLTAAAGGRLLPGMALVDAWLDLERRIAAADIVITGEGRFDDSSLDGKGPGAIAARALALGKPTHVFAGQTSAPGAPAALRLHAITSAGAALTEALRSAEANLHRAIATTFAPA